MAKRRKRSRSSKRPDPKTTRVADAQPGAEDREPDPLALPAWPSSQSPPPEAGERLRFERAWDLFRSGDFHNCRNEAASLATEASAEEVRLRALALGDRLRVDPLALAVAAGALLLLLVTLLVTFG